jgi:hypothetical protein
LLLGEGVGRYYGCLAGEGKGDYESDYCWLLDGGCWMVVLVLVPVMSVGMRGWGNRKRES